MALWGCGMSCTHGAVVNLRTGRAVSLPGSVCCSGDEEDRLQYHKDSRLFIAYGRIDEGKTYGKHFYEFTGREFKHLRTIALEDTYMKDFGVKMRKGFEDAQVVLDQQNMERATRENGVARGWLGIQVQDLTPGMMKSLDLSDGNGALVSGILKDGPAGRAGVESGDVVVSVNGKLVADSSSLVNLVASMKPGETARLVVARRNLSFEYMVRVERRP